MSNYCIFNRLSAWFKAERTASSSPHQIHPPMVNWGLTYFLWRDRAANSTYGMFWNELFNWPFSHLATCLVHCERYRLAYEEGYDRCIATTFRWTVLKIFNTALCHMCLHVFLAWPASDSSRWLFRTISCFHRIVHPKLKSHPVAARHLCRWRHGAIFFHPRNQRGVSQRGRMLCLRYCVK